MGAAAVSLANHATRAEIRRLHFVNGLSQREIPAYTAGRRLRYLAAQAAASIARQGTPRISGASSPGGARCAVGTVKDLEAHSPTCSGPSGLTLPRARRPRRAPPARPYPRLKLPAMGGSGGTATCALMTLRCGCASRCVSVVPSIDLARSVSTPCDARPMSYWTEGTRPGSRGSSMPYVTCPSCQKIGYVPPTHRAYHLCSRFGAALPVRRSVVPISRLQQAGADAREPAVQAA